MYVFIYMHCLLLLVQFKIYYIIQIFFFTISVQASNVANVLLFCFAVQLRYIQDLYITRTCILFLLMCFKLFLIKSVPLEYVNH